SKQRKRKRRTHHKMPVANLSACPNCGDPKLPHRVCPTCGTYKGEQVVDIDEL
ncbi:MAG: 50S ribosomal protein L32, partial [Gemmatimonadetes bacterium]|nr:50S ribosomal protein L32 [Gemmatimonadota bacterium]NIQ52217.1 50S ribosomal protein L32 [Gemmatimonadota bacterium]NIU72318.1 50S ribosomal protein L32 [Gammaproteobacteria bacterium]NIX42814.1 50S ribosomal protein L32 [Gemmatimonadota bacterium]NIY08323.1 50S ribosomal protein L32 [Gemmatimonadota bacterium]